MKSTYTRDVSPEMMKELKNRDTFAAFVDYVRENEHNDLALCFRGNDSELGKVVIYRNNHMIWELCFKDSKGSIPVVRINPNHARFMKDWHSRIVKDFMGLGFKGPKGQDYEQLKKENGFVVRHKIKNGYSYDAVFLEYTPSGGYDEVKKVVTASYSLLKEMQESYFRPKHVEEFDVYYPRSKEPKKERRPRNYIKQYYFEHNTDAGTVDSNSNFYANFQKCIEKHVQQDLFMNNHCLKDGLFIYDLEFAQPSGVPGVKVGNKNKPDMFALRFDSKGKIKSICMIEVKSTKSALKQKSGLKEHLIGMEEYIHVKKLMDHRIKEAKNILKQYHELGLYGVDKGFTEFNFKKIKKEIIFVLTHELNLNVNIHRGVSIWKVLPGFVAYEKMEYGEYLRHADVLIKSFPKMF